MRQHLIQTDVEYEDFQPRTAECHEAMESYRRRRARAFADLFSAYPERRASGQRRYAAMVAGRRERRVAQTYARTSRAVGCGTVIRRVG